jgi:hypothetical protein|uniref:Uncharacterized protein n=1 Tax=Desulfobacca acetoxidans TaxID=60893 RepID=A0A7C5AL57_9BACT
MDDLSKVVCPIPHLGYCVYERCNFWDHEKGECSGLCFGEYTPLDADPGFKGEGACIIWWIEDSD